MKTEKMFTTLAVLALAASLAPSVGAQMKKPEKPAPKTSQVPKGAAKTTTHVAVPAKTAVVHKATPAKPLVAQKAVAAKPRVASHKMPAAKPHVAAHKVEAKKPHVEHSAVAAKLPAVQPKPEAVAVEPVISRRDPFAPLIAVTPSGGRGEHLPPGKAGLEVSTVRVDGAVTSPNGMLAVVSNPDDRVYFVHVGDRLYDGDVEQITLDGVTFKENSKDAFGKPVERLVTKRIYPNVGESQ